MDGIFTRVLLIIFCVSAASCADPAVPNKEADSSNYKDEPTKSVASDKVSAKAMLTDLTSRASAPPDKPKIVSFRDEQSDGQPMCTYAIRYDNVSNHEISWSGNTCAELTADFMTIGELKSFDKLKRLDQETREQLTNYHQQGVFYIEGEFTASIYPLNASGVPHEVSVAD
jgi:hypothetical protein